MQKVSDIIKKCFGYSNALLSGSMDIIVIKQPSGKLEATPLRLRFSNYRVPRAGRKKVTVKVNGKIIDLPMFLQKDGRAFILLENKKYKENKSSQINSSKSFITETENIDNNNLNKSFEEVKTNKHNSLSLSPLPNKSINNNNIINDVNSNDNGNDNGFMLNVSDKNESEISFNNDEVKNEEEVINNIKTIVIEKENNQNNIKLELSDCWDNISRNKYNKNFNLQGEFLKKIINKDEFFKDPWKIIKNPNLAIKYGNQILTSKVIIPMMFSQLVYGCPLPEEVVNNLTESQDGLFFWKTKHKDAYRIDLEQLSLSSNENENETELKSSNYNSDGSLSKEKYNIRSKTIYSDSKFKKRKYRMRKSSKFSSQILEQFELKNGMNEIEYIVDGYTISSNIYLWDYTDKIVISDFDGTITRSDVIGQIGVYFGIDWTHKYIAKLYSHIVNNGYKMLYVTARTMYMQSSTKNSLSSINQDGFLMPIGPIMMNDNGYVDSIKTEIIDKAPQEFKIECLFNILKLFPPDVDP
jgi:phosphatidate phosphatase LPIN